MNLSNFCPLRISGSTVISLLAWWSEFCGFDWCIFLKLTYMKVGSRKGPVKWRQLVWYLPYHPLNANWSLHMGLAVYTKYTKMHEKKTYFFYSSILLVAYSWFSDSQKDRSYHIVAHIQRFFYNFMTGSWKSEIWQLHISVYWTVMCGPYFCMDVNAGHSETKCWWNWRQQSCFW